MVGDDVDSHRAPTVRCIMTTHLSRRHQRDCRMARVKKVVYLRAKDMGPLKEAVGEFTTGKVQYYENDLSY